MRYTPTRRTAARGLFLAAALLSFVLSVFLYFGGDEIEGIFVGIWVPSILALGAFLVPRHDPETRERVERDRR
ncbi:MAG TPA: hypothetical protein VHI33_02145 [Solirubrobacterales bacterium]|nr:hypothetical protein [Solirubrobacterales bacterium]